MRRLILPLLICLIVSSAANAAPTYPDAVVAIFAFGDSRGWMGDGFAIGDGQWVVTTAEVVTESIPVAKTAGKPATEIKLPIKYVTVLSPWTGDAYRAEVKAVDAKKNLAILKLSVSGLPSAPLAGTADLDKAPGTTTGELFSGKQIGSRWQTKISALTSSSSSKLALKQWTAVNAAVAESKGTNWLFVSKIDPETLPPRASMVWRDNIGAVGLYNGKLSIGASNNAPSYGQCLISTEIIKSLGKSNIDAATLSKIPAPTLQPDKTAEQGFQLIWATLTDTILSKWPEAQKNAKALVDLRPESAMANLLMGVALAGGGKPEEAVKSMDKAISLDDKVFGGYFTRGAALASLGKTKEAEADLRKAVEQSPGDVKPMLALADLIASDKARRKEASEIAGQAVQSSPQNPRARLALALILKGAGSYDQAIAEFKQTLKVIPGWGVAKAALAATYEASGDITSAETTYRELAKAEPQNPDATYTLAAFLADHDKKDEARELLTKLLAMEKLPKEIQTAATELQKKL